MKKFFTKNWIFWMIGMVLIMCGMAGQANAQTITQTDLGDNLGATAMCKDASGNVYVIRSVSAFTFETQATDEVVEYPISGGSPVVLNSNIGLDQSNDGGYTSPNGIAIDASNNIYVTTYIADDGHFGSILKLPAGNYSSPSTFYSGNSSAYAYFGGLVVDTHGNLYTMAYDWNGNSGAGTYDLLEFPNATGTTTFSGSPTQIGTHVGDAEQNEYNNLHFTGIYTPVSAMAIDGSNNIYVASAYGFTNTSPSTPVDGGSLYKFTSSGNGTFSSSNPSPLHTSVYVSSLAVDPSGNLYATELTNASSSLNIAQLVSYGFGGASSATPVYTSLGQGLNLLCWGIAVINSTDIYVINGEVASSGKQGDIYELFGAPATQASGVSFSSTTVSGTTINWTNGSGSSRAVFMSTGTGTPSPSNGTTYTANTSVGSGSQAGSGWYCVYNGSGSTNSVGVTGLSPIVTYKVMVVEYNGVSGAQNYNINPATNNPNTVTTPTPTLTTAGGTATLPATVQGTPGSSTNFTISGSNLFPASGNITVTPPANVQLSEDNANWYSLIRFGYSSNALPNTTVFARLAGTGSVGTISGNVSISGGGATTINQAVSGSLNSPSTTIASLTPSVTITNGSSVTYTATFAAAVSSLTSSDFSVTPSGSVTGASVTSVTGSGTSWTITVSTGSGDGSVQLVMNSSTGTSPSVSNVPFSGTAVTIDRTAPTVTISAPSVTFANSSTSVTYTVTWADANLNSSTITLSPLTAYNNRQVTGTAAVNQVQTTPVTGNSMTVTFSNITGNGTFNWSIPAGTAQDNAGNQAGAGAAPAQAVTIDNTAPTVVSLSRTDPNPSNETQLDYQIVFSEPVTGVDPSDFTAVTGGGVTAGAVSVTPISSTTYNLSVATVSGTGTLQVNLNSSGTGITDAAGNAIFGGFNGDTYNVDQTPPTVQSITATTPSNTNPTNAGTLIYTVTFDKAVTGVDATDFTVTTSGTSGNVTDVSGSGSTYTVTLTGVGGNGTLRLDLNSSGTGITDATGNAIATGFTTGDTYTIDTNAPTVFGGSYQSNGVNMSYAKLGDVLTLAFTSSETIQTPSITIAGHTITPVNTSGNTWSASYTETSSDTEGPQAFDLVVTDLAGNSTEYNSPGVGLYVTYDETPPTVAGSSPSVAATNTGPVTYTITYSDTNFNQATLSSGDISLSTTGTANASTINVSNSFNVSTVTLSGITGDGTLGISIAANTGQDLAGNEAPAAGPFATFNVDNTAPAVTSITATTPSNASPTTATTLTYTVTFSEPVINVDNTAFTGTTTGNVTYDFITATQVNSTTYTVSLYNVHNDGTIRLDFTNSGATPVTDAVGNGAAAFSSGDVYTIDNTPPTITTATYLSNNSNNTAYAHAGDVVTFTATYSEAVVNPTLTIGSTSVTLNNTGGNTWTGSYTVTAGDPAGYLYFDNNVTDAAGNTAEFANSDINQYVNVDNTQPTIVIGNSSLANTNTGPVTYTVNYDDLHFDQVTLSPSDISLNTTGDANAQIGVSTVGPNSTITLSNITGNGTIGISIAAGTGHDIAGNQAPAAGPSNTFNVDNTAPTIVSITGVSPSQVAPQTNATSVGYMVTFSKGVTGVTSSAFTLNTTGNITYSGISVYPAGGNQYNVYINDIAGSGNVNLDLSNTAGITDDVGNTVTGPFDSPDTYRIDHTAPAVQSITATTPSNVNPTKATSLVYTVTFTEPVTYVPSSVFTVNNLTGTVAYNSVTVNTVSPSVYTVTIDGVSGDGTVRLDLDNSSQAVQDSSGNVAANYTGGDVYQIDQTVPTVAISAPSAIEANNSGNASVSYTVTYADANFNSSNLTLSGITLNRTGTANGTLNVSGSGTSYTVKIAHITGEGTLGISVAGGYATDIAGNTDAGTGPSATFVVESVDNKLSSLGFSGGPLSPVFSPTGVSYTATTQLTAVTITPVAEDASSAIEINGMAAVSGTPFPLMMNGVSNNINIKVTAQNGSIRLYKIIVAKNSSNNVAVSLNLNPVSTLTVVSNTATTNNMTTSVSASTSTVALTATTVDPNASITINGTSVASGTPSGPILLNTDGTPTPVIVVVTAQDGTQKTHVISISKDGSSDLNVALKLSPASTLTLVNNTATMSNLTTSVSASTTSVVLTPTTDDPNATVTINGTSVASGTPSEPIVLNTDGTPTIVTVVVTAQNGMQKTRLISISKDGSSDLEATLKLSPASTLTVVNNTTTMSNLTTSVSASTSSVALTTTTSDPNASITVNGTSVTSGTPSGPIALNTDGTPTPVTVVVTAQNGMQKTYLVSISKEGSSDLNATLNLSPASTLTAVGYSPALRTFSTSVSPSTTSVTLTVVSNGVITVNGSPLASGGTSAPIVLNTDGTPTPVTTLVTAEDGEQRTYVINISKEGSSDVGLKLRFNPQCTLTRVSGTISMVTYNTTVSASTASVALTPTTDDPNATVTVNGISVASGTASDPIALNVGDNTITAVTTAQDGTTTKTYIVVVHRPDNGSSDAVTLPAITQTLRPDLAENVVVHTAVSPNGDGQNDVLTIDNIQNYPDNKLQIMNGNGQLIYEAKGYDNAARVFDGHSNKNGQLQLPGTYFYSLEYKVNGETKHKTGYIVLKY